RTPDAAPTHARHIALANGLRYVYTGNVHDREGGSTWCPHCHTRLIERDWYELGEWKLTDTGACRRCGTAIPGVFSGPPGDWGARRLSVRLAARMGPARWDFAVWLTERRRAGGDHQRYSDRSTPG